MKVVIPSRWREKDIGSMSLSIFPGATVCVEESEVDNYTSCGVTNLLPHPPLPSLAAIRNWIIGNVPDEMFFMPDDDIECVYSMVGKSFRKYTDPAVIMQIVDNAGEIAFNIGAGLFGFNQSMRPYAFSPFQPIKFSTWVGTAVGIIGKDIRYDTAFSLHDDFDFSMQQLLTKRIILCDQRFHFAGRERLRNKGGNTKFRSSEREAAELNLLKHKWGDYMSYFKHASSDRNQHMSIGSFVKRRQS
jgi:hypothetical protein